MTTPDPAPPFWWETKSLTELTRDEWEALCDGCGRCCLHKLEDADNGRQYLTNVACRLLDLRSCRCRHYPDRQRQVPDCVQLTPDNIAACTWLPETCAYRRRAAGRALPDWHPLISGRRDSVHETGASVRDWAITERPSTLLEEHIVAELS